MEQNVTYYLTQAGFGFYGVLEGAFIIRLVNKHLGLGALIQYKKASMFARGSKYKLRPDLNNMAETIEEQSQEEREVSGSESRFRPPSQNDIMFSPFRHLDSMHLLTFGFIADWRF